ncbi:MAG: thiol reductase thioredoxin, partial [Mycobacteriaceae bacterium]
ILVYRDAGALPPKALKDLIVQVEGLDMEDVRKKVAEQNS